MVAKIPLLALVLLGSPLLLRSLVRCCHLLAQCSQAVLLEVSALGVSQPRHLLCLAREWAHTSFRPGDEEPKIEMDSPTVALVSLAQTIAW